MEIISAVTSVGTFVVAIIGVWIALSQLRSASRDAQASRTAEMSWQVYQAYVEPRIRDARGAAEKIAHTDPVPSSGSEYGKQYADKEVIVPEPKNVSVDTYIRRLLRFYNQVGILVEKHLVDEDIVFEFIGPGLKSVWPVIVVAIDWYRKYPISLSGHEKIQPRRIYVYVTKLYELYLKWEEAIVSIEAYQKPLESSKDHV